MSTSQTVTVRVTAEFGPTSTMLHEKFDVRYGDLDDVLKVLNRFHELAEKIRDEQAGLVKAVK